MVESEKLICGKKHCRRLALGSSKYETNPHPCGNSGRVVFPYQLAVGA
jgi:hypothetical protein